MRALDLDREERIPLRRARLKRLRDEAGGRIHFWPFDGWVPALGKSVVAEVYPSIFRNRYPTEGRTADEQDAYAVACWPC